jgi:hypothetical protein
MRVNLTKTIYEAEQSANYNSVQISSGPWVFKDVSTVPLIGMNKHMARKYQMHKCKWITPLPSVGDMKHFLSKMTATSNQKAHHKPILSTTRYSSRHISAVRSTTEGPVVWEVCSLIIQNVDARCCPTGQGLDTTEDPLGVTSCSVSKKGQ